MYSIKDSKLKVDWLKLHKRVVQSQKMKILSSFTQPHFVQYLYYFPSSVGHKVLKISRNQRVLVTIDFCYMVKKKFCIQLINSDNLVFDWMYNESKHIKHTLLIKSLGVCKMYFIFLFKAWIYLMENTAKSKTAVLSLINAVTTFI